MTDRELLETAAKAAGYNVTYKAKDCYGKKDGNFYFGVGGYTPQCWNPLKDDGDGARLEAALGMPVHWWGNCVTVNNGAHGSGATEFFTEHGGDRQAARRKASVIAAAALAAQLGREDAP